MRCYYKVMNAFLPNVPDSQKQVLKMPLCQSPPPTPTPEPAVDHNPQLGSEVYKRQQGSGATNVMNHIRAQYARL